MQSEVEEFIKRRCNRAIRNILRYTDANVKSDVADDVAVGLRDVVMNELNEFAELMREVVAVSADERVTINGVWLETLGRIRESIAAANGQPVLEGMSTGAGD